MSLTSTLTWALGPGTVVYLSQISPDITVGVLGVPVNVILACGLGAYASFSFGDAVTPRSRMINLFVACIIIGAGFTSIANATIEHFMRVHLLPGVQAGLGSILSCLSRFIIPAVIERIPKWLDRIPFLRKDRGD